MCLITILNECFKVLDEIWAMNANDMMYNTQQLGFHFTPHSNSCRNVNTQVVKAQPSGLTALQNNGWKPDSSSQCSLALQAWPTARVRIHIAHVVDAARSQDVIDADDVLVAET